MRAFLLTAGQQAGAKVDWESRIEEKIDKVSDKIEIINTTLAKQHENLKEHMRRTEVAEKTLNLFKEEFKPIQVHVSRVEGGLKLIGIIGIIASIVTGSIEVFNYLK